VPVGAHATLEGSVIHLRAIVISPDGARVVRGELRGNDPAELGDTLGKKLLGEGAREILSEVYGT